MNIIKFHDRAETRESDACEYDQNTLCMCINLLNLTNTKKYKNTMILLIILNEIQYLVPSYTETFKFSLFYSVSLSFLSLSAFSSLQL